MALGPHVADLERDVAGALAAFEAADPFTGPARYFHLQAIARRRAAGGIRAALADEALLRDIYATLTAWGMHRLGARGAKLAEFDVFATSLRAAEPALRELAAFRLTDLREGEVAALTDQLWALLSGLTVSTRRSQLVAGSKAVHHLLPDLVPPIDRAYTLRFALGQRTIRSSGESEFRAAFPTLVHIAGAGRAAIEAAVGRGFHTGIAKTVDNAIVGYTLTHLD